MASSPPNKMDISEITSIGELDCYVDVEWKIKDFLMLKNCKLFSPMFSVAGCQFKLQMVCGRASDSKKLYLYRADTKRSEREVTFKLGIKTQWDTVRTLASNTKGIKSCAVSKICGLIYASELFINKYLSSEGTLTVTCSMKVHESFEIDTIAAGVFKLSKNFKEMFISQQFCDVTFEVHEKRFPAHKSVLACRSPVFEKMFKSGKKKKGWQESNSNVVTIVDCDPEPFGEFLLYLYSGNFDDLSPANVLDVYRMADKYHVEDLKSNCAISMANNITIENLFDVAVLVNLIGEEKLETKVQTFFNENFASVVSNPKWKPFTKEHNDLSNHLLENFGEKN